MVQIHNGEVEIKSGAAEEEKKDDDVNIGAVVNDTNSNEAADANDAMEAVDGQ